MSAPWVTVLVHREGGFYYASTGRGEVRASSAPVAVRLAGAAYFDVGEHDVEILALGNNIVRVGLKKKGSPLFWWIGVPLAIGVAVTSAFYGWLLLGGAS